MKKSALFILIFTLSQLYKSLECSSQPCIGLNGGYFQGKFIDFNNENKYETGDYHFKGGISYSIFYENKIGSISNFRIELQYKLINMGYESKYYRYNDTFDSSLVYSSKLLNMNLIYLIKIKDTKFLKLCFLTGGILSYNIKTRAKGAGMQEAYIQYIGNNGYPYYQYIYRKWEVDDHNSNGLTKFNFGIANGFELKFALYKRIDLLFQNRYEFFLTRIIAAADPRNTRFFSIDLNLGLRYNL